MVLVLRETAEDKEGGDSLTCYLLPPLLPCRFSISMSWISATLLFQRITTARFLLGRLGKKWKTLTFLHFWGLPSFPSLLFFQAREPRPVSLTFFPFPSFPTNSPNSVFPASLPITPCPMKYLYTVIPRAGTRKVYFLFKFKVKGKVGSLPKNISAALCTISCHCRQSWCKTQRQDAKPDGAEEESDV